MFKNYVKTAFRSLRKGGIYSTLNLAGLTIGTATVILLALFVHDEWSFDKFHEKSDRIYRAWVKEHVEGEVFFNTVTPYVMGPELRDNFPEIQKMARYATVGTLVKNGNFSEPEQMHVVEPDFLEIFDFKLLRGKKEQVLTGLNNVVLTEELGEKYFALNPHPVGQTLTMQMNGEWTDFTVAGVIEKAPGNSSIQYDLLIPFENMKSMVGERGRTSWTNVNVSTYMLLREGETGAELAAKVAPFMDEKVADMYEAGEYIVGFQPLTDIHLNAEFPTGIEPVSNAEYPKILFGVAVLILLLAAINFTTIAIGRSVGRAREVGVRKVTGATKGQLMMQFWSEAILTAAISVLGGVLLVELVLPFFNTLSDKQLAFDFTLSNIAACTGLAIFTGLLSGAYPAVVQAGFSPIRSLRGMVSKMGSDKHFVLRGLVGFQFLLSILLVGCTLVMGQQLRFLQNKNLGFDREQVVVLPYENSGMRFSEMWAEGGRLTERLRNELAGNPAFQDFTWSNHTFGTAGWMNIGYTDQEENRFRDFSLNGIGPRFVPMMGLEMLEGRYPDPSQNAADERAVVVNEAFAATFGAEVGQPLQAPFQDFKVVGIAKNFHFESLHTAIEPLVLAAMPLGLLQAASDRSMAESPNPKISVKISGENIPATIAQLRQAWQKIAPDQAFDYAFLDDKLDRQYRAEERFSQVVSLSTGLAIFIACLGLFGIATLSIARRTKEIGVRKVLGATTADIVLMLNKNFTFLVLVASVLALPLAWYFMSGWLDDFAYRIDISPLTLVFSGALALVLTWVIVGWQSFRAAAANPVDSLRNE